MSDSESPSKSRPDSRASSRCFPPWRLEWGNPEGGGLLGLVEDPGSLEPACPSLGIRIWNCSVGDQVISWEQMSKRAASGCISVSVPCIHSSGPVYVLCSSSGTSWHCETDFKSWPYALGSVKGLLI
eukprot:3702856-Rhodomonas_salina.2